MHYQTVGYLERGEYAPSLHPALRIAAYFEVPAEIVFSTGSGSRPAWAQDLIGGSCRVDNALPDRNAHGTDVSGRGSQRRQHAAQPAAGRVGAGIVGDLHDRP